jgi:large repetitive protein
MANLALLDLLLPYVLRGENLGSFHALASALRVTSYEQAADPLGVTVRGRGEFNGSAKLFPGGSFSVSAGVDESAPVYDPTNRQPVFDLAETAIEFELLVPRIRSDIVFAGETSVAANSAFKDAKAVLDALAGPATATTTDYPSTGFTLDLILDAPGLRPPFLHPAKLADAGTLVPDESVNEVTLTLPKLRFRLSHGDANPSQLRFELTSLGATGLDDPADLGVAELISMSPPYAYIGGSESNTIGIGFRSATLDLSADNTPPALKDKAGVGDDWTGLYLPEARLFYSPNGVRNMAFEGGAHEFLVGIGHDSAGIWGDFEVAVIEQGDAAPVLTARFMDANNKIYGIESTGTTTATARLPAHTRMIVDVSGGRMPYTRTVTIAGGAPEQSTIFIVDLSNVPDNKAEIAISVTDTSPVPKTATLTITAQLVAAPALLPSPAPTTPPTQPATMTPPTGIPTVAMQTQTDTDVVLTSVPPDPTLMWQIDAAPETGPVAALHVPLAPGEQHTVKVRKPGTAATARADTIYFFFDRPPPKQDDAYPRAYSSSKAISKTVNVFEQPDVDPLTQYKDHLDAVAKTAHDTATDITIPIEGRASFEGIDDPWHRQHNYLLAGRRAAAARDLIAAAYPEPHLKFAITPEGIAPTKPQIDQWVTDTAWNDPSHVTPNDRDYWCAIATLPAVSTPEHTSSVTISRPAAPPPPNIVVPVDPTPKEPDPPGWFRSFKLIVRIVKGDVIAAEADLQAFIQGFVHESLEPTAVNTDDSPVGRSLTQGVPVGPDNPTDGITNFRLLVQSDPSTGREQIVGSIGADPADTSGLMVWGWLPGELRAPRDVVRNLMGSYLTFWPLLADLPLDAAAGRASSENALAAVVDVGLSAAAMLIPAAIGALPFLEVERIVWYGGEVHVGLRSGTDEVQTDILADIAVAWATTAPIVDVLSINPDKPLTVRYKAIGVHTANRDATGKAAFELHPIFDASRGYTIDVQGSGSLVIADPLGKILRILAARLSRTNPLTLEIDIGMSVDLGVVTVTRAGVRVYLDDPTRPPELTALGVSVDIADALVGSGFVQMAHSTDPQGQPVATIGGQIDLTLRPIDLRIAAAVEIATITLPDGGTATGVYVALDIVLPVGIPLGTSGLGIFGFRGIFGMHYDRSPYWDRPGQPASALVWLENTEGHPEHLANSKDEKLWVPYLDHWVFGAGILIGTMEGGFIINLDGTLLIQLPGPRVVILMNARILSVIPDTDEIGMAAGILAVIEITPDHFLIGVLISWEIPDLITIKIPVEALFPFGADASKWHVYLGARHDVGQPVEVDVLGIVKGTGYLMAKGDGLVAYTAPNFTLPALTGFAIGLGMAASFTWGDTGAGLYLRVGGGMDAELGFQPFTLAGTIYVSGELRLFIVSIGADAELDVIAAQHHDDQTHTDSFGVRIDGHACGHVSFLFFEVHGCVDITLSIGGDTSPPFPNLVTKVSLQSRSPALAQGTGVDRGIDVSLGDALESDSVPGTGTDLPVVPIDAIPIIALAVPPAVVNDKLIIGGLNTGIGPSPGAPNPSSPDNQAAYCEHGGDRYQYVISAVALERIDPGTGQPAGAAIDEATGPAVWWTLAGPADPSPVAQLALLTWAPTPATKAIEQTDRLTDGLTERYRTICAPVAPAAEQLWTFRFEPGGYSAIGWDLEGIAWPDPPGSVRSTNPPSMLHVGERWRSGDAVLDAARGIFPAFVLGSTVACSPDFGINPQVLQLLTGRDTAPAPAAPAVPRLVVGGRGPIDGAPSSGGAVALDDPVHAALVRNPVQQPIRISAALHRKVTDALARQEHDEYTMTVPEVVRTLQDGTGIGVAALRAALSPARLAASATGQRGDLASSASTRCGVHVLQAPLFDDGRPVAIGDQSRAADIAARLKALGVTHGDLDNVVVVSTGAFATFGVLLYVQRELLVPGVPGDVVVRGLGADGAEHQRVNVTSADLLSSRPVPVRWTDPTGPWADDTVDLLSLQTDTIGAVYVELDADPLGDRVEVGTQRPASALNPDGLDREGIEPAFYLAAVAETRWSETLRVDFDTSQQVQDQQVLTQLLGSASDQNAFLYADSLYRVTVEWTGKRLKDNGPATSLTQRHWFRTDRIIADPTDAAKLQFASTPPVPVRLDSWLLMTIPDEAEKAYFGHEDIKLVFNTQDLDRLLSRYGKKMQIRFQAASAQHPQSTPAVPHPYPLDPTTVATVPATLLSPFEDALQAALEALGDAAACVPVDDQRVRHSQVDIPIPLNSCTDYLLDVELVDEGAPDGTAGPSIFRRHFGTGLYGTFEQFASSIISPLPTARSAPAGAFAATAAFFAGRRPAGSELDDQLRGHGIEPLETPARARVVVFWEQSGSADPQPAAVLVDATEPLFRSRNYPSKVTDSTGPDAAQRWVLGPREWLLLRPHPIPDPAVPDPATVAPDGVIVAPGGQRAVVVLASNQRGKRLVLDLVAAGFADLPFLDAERSTTVVDMTFAAAPWEEI